VGSRAHANQRRWREGACDDCCVEAERGRNGERGSNPAHAKRGGGSDARGVEEDGARRPELHEHGGGGCQSGTCRVKQGKS
jgi:hypothetical protein